jgi:glycine cleavage system H protein
MTFPEELFYTADHEWVKIEGDIATVGITEFAQSELGDIVFVEIETVGDAIGSGDIFGTVEAVKTVSDLFLPLAGQVVEKNSELDNEPELVNADPYGKGWMIKLKLDSVDTSSLLSAEAYKALIGQ